MHTPRKIALIYAAFALTWILFSDMAVKFAAGGDEGFITAWQSTKGMLFVVVTATILYLVVRYYFLKVEESQREKREVFDSTLDTASQIINNFLNDIIYFRMVAEDSPFIEQEVLEQFDKVIRATVDQLGRLAELEDVSPGKIRAWLEQDEGHYYCPLPGDETHGRI